MKYNPHDYQAYATQFIIDHRECALLLDCGLGKSVITLTALYELILDRFEVTRCLVIAPLRVATMTWPDEIAKWDHLQGLTYSVICGSAEERTAALQQNTHLHIINRENVVWLEEMKKKGGGVPDYDMIVIDELSSFKSPTAKRFKSLLRMRPHASRVVGLTGTPTSNGLLDLWAEYRVLDMGQRLGRFVTNYRNAYFKPDKRSATQIFSWKIKNPQAEEEIYGRIADMTVSMRATDHLQMPELIESVTWAQLDERERGVYDELKNEMILELEDGEEITALSAAALSGKLCQLANGAIYSEEGYRNLHDRKLDALEDLIEAANGKTVLVAYWFKFDSERIRARFPQARELKTEKDIRDWNDKKIPVGLIHPASAGHGLNLQRGGNTLIWYGMTWSLELYQQTNARLYRQGQSESTVVINHILTRGTIDARVLEALRDKNVTQERLIAAVRAELKSSSGGYKNGEQRTAEDDQCDGGAAGAARR